MMRAIEIRESCLHRVRATSSAAIAVLIVAGRRTLGGTIETGRLERAWQDAVRHGVLASLHIDLTTHATPDSK